MKLEVACLHILRKLLCIIY